MEAPAASTILTLDLNTFSEPVPMNAAATAMGLSLTSAFVGRFPASPPFGLFADLTGSCSVSIRTPWGPPWVRPAFGLAVDATGGYDAAVVVLGLLGPAAYATLLPLGSRPEETAIKKG